MSLSFFFFLKDKKAKTKTVINDIITFFFFQMIAKGKNASELFPAVVKNVASKNIEVFLQHSKNTLIQDLFMKILADYV